MQEFLQLCEESSVTTSSTLHAQNGISLVLWRKYQP